VALAEAATVTLSEDMFTSQAAHRVQKDQTGAGLSESDGGALHVRESAAQPERVVRQINFKSTERRKEVATSRQHQSLPIE
jgi:hypothetical protein